MDMGFDAQHCSRYKPLVSPIGWGISPKKKRHPVRWRNESPNPCDCFTLYLWLIHKKTNKTVIKFGGKQLIYNFGRKKNCCKEYGPESSNPFLITKIPTKLLVDVLKSTQSKFKWSPIWVFSQFDSVLWIKKNRVSRTIFGKCSSTLLGLFFFMIALCPCYGRTNQDDIRDDIEEDQIVEKVVIILF